MKLGDMKTAREVLADDLEDPKFREEWERTALAREVATRVVAYRAEHNLSQEELGRHLGISQPAVARIEAGDHEPTLSRLRQLSRSLDMEFHIDITQQGLTLATA
jgi:ribosome-binding protein aMBF1 (putative translation factor)